MVLTLSSADVLELFLLGSRYAWHMTPIVRGELTRRKTRQIVDRSLAAGALALVEIDTTNSSEMHLWAQWNLVVDVGEAEAIALGLSRNWTIGIEDRQAQRALDRRVAPGHWVNCVNLLLDAVTDHVMTAQEADSLFRSFDSYPGYRKRGILSLTSL